MMLFEITALVLAIPSIEGKTCNINNTWGELEMKVLDGVNFPVNVGEDVTLKCFGEPEIFKIFTCLVNGEYDAKSDSHCPYCKVGDAWRSYISPQVTYAPQGSTLSFQCKDIKRNITCEELNSQSKDLQKKCLSECPELKNQLTVFGTVSVSNVPIGKSKQIPCPNDPGQNIIANCHDTGTEWLLGLNFWQCTNTELSAALALPWTNETPTADAIGRKTQEVLSLTEKKRRFGHEVLPSEIARFGEAMNGFSAIKDLAYTTKLDIVESWSNLLGLPPNGSFTESTYGIYAKTWDSIIRFMESQLALGSSITSRNMAVFKLAAGVPHFITGPSLLDYRQLKVDTAHPTNHILSVDVNSAGINFLTILTSKSHLHPSKTNQTVDSPVVEIKIPREDVSFKMSIAVFNQRGGNVSGHHDNGSLVQEHVHTCSKYDTNTFKWVATCVTSSDKATPEEGVSCQCTHNTSFAMLMSAKPITAAHNKAQSHLTMVLGGTSCLLLLVSIMVFVFLKDQRGLRSVRIHIGLASTLFLACLSFLLHDVLAKHDNSKPLKMSSTGCLVYAMFQHYIWLSVFCWMLIEGIGMYLSLVRVFGSHVSKFLLKAAVFSFVFPVLFPGAALLIFGRKQYLSSSLCLIKENSLTFYVFFVLPMCAILICNCFVFFNVLKVIRASSTNQPEKCSVQKELKAATGVSICLGLGWILGFFITRSLNDTLSLILQYLFIILNASQGIMFFLMYVLGNESIQKSFSSGKSKSSRSGTALNTISSRVSQTHRLTTVQAPAPILNTKPPLHSASENGNGRRRSSVVTISAGDLVTEVHVDIEYEINKEKSSEEGSSCSVTKVTQRITFPEAMVPSREGTPRRSSVTTTEITTTGRYTFMDEKDRRYGGTSGETGCGFKEDPRVKTDDGIVLVNKIASESFPKSLNVEVESPNSTGQNQELSNQGRSVLVNKESNLHVLGKAEVKTPTNHQGRPSCIITKNQKCNEDDLFDVTKIEDERQRVSSDARNPLENDQSPFCQADDANTGREDMVHLVVSDDEASDDGIVNDSYFQRRLYTNFEGDSCEDNNNISSCHQYKPHEMPEVEKNTTIIHLKPIKTPLVFDPACKYIIYGKHTMDYDWDSFNAAQLFLASKNGIFSLLQRPFTNVHILDYRYHNLKANFVSFNKWKPAVLTGFVCLNGKCHLDFTSVEKSDIVYRVRMEENDLFCVPQNWKSETSFRLLWLTDLGVKRTMAILTSEDSNTEDIRP